MPPYIQPLLSAMTVFIPSIAGVFLIINCLIIATAKRRYVTGRLHVSQIEFDTQMRLFHLTNVVIAAGAVVFTAGAYFLKAYYLKG